MGHHFVPQRYLKGFQAPERPGFLWMHDKQEGESKLVPISKVAQSPEFYEEDVEKSLDQDVERPGNDVIDKLRRGESIDDEDRRHFAYYIATMIRRVPHARARAQKLLPQAL